MPVLLSVFFGFIPMLFYAWFIYWLDRYEKEPSILLGGVFIWGAVFAAAAAFIINSLIGMGVYLFTESTAATELTTGLLVAPIVEETLKGLSILVVFLVFRNEFDSVLDGIVYAAISALGFAATENAFYIYTYGYQQSGYGGMIWLIFVRVILVGWQHPFYTAFTGIGLAMARGSRNSLVKIVAPLGGFGLAIIVHALHNAIASMSGDSSGLVIGALYDWTGWFFMFLFILWVTGRERRLLTLHLREEVTLGILSPAQYRIACSAWSQGLARFKALGSGRYRDTRQF